MKKRGVILFLLALTTIPTVFAGQVYYLHPDYVGSPVVLTDSSGNAVEEYAYDPYGKQFTTLEGDVDNPIGFTGQRFDDSVGLNHFYFRTYDPELGRFLQRDPSGYADGVNLYEYVSGNPLGNIDELGLSTGPIRRAARAVARVADNLDPPPIRRDPIIVRPTNKPYISPLATGKTGAVRKRGRPSKYGDDSLGYYREHFSGLTRMQLQARAPGLYQRLRKEGLLSEVPEAKRGRPLKYRDDSLAYYREHYPGLTRSQLQDQAPGLYRRLLKEGLISGVPKGPSIFGDDPLAYYREHYPGLTRGELAKVRGGLYNVLWRRGLLSEVPLKNPVPIYANDPLAYYWEHYPGLTRSQLQDQVPGLYYRLRKGGLLSEVPEAKRGKPSKYGDDPLAYYWEHYPGLTRGRLYKRDMGLYSILKKYKLLGEVPLARQR
jgi:RHS repeat-associated protein